MKKLLGVSLALTLIFAASCSDAKKGYPVDTYNLKPGNQMENAPDWYKSAVFYHIWVRAFNDAKYDDGLGDLKGITKKMGYLEDLGVTAIWLSPIFDCGKKKSNVHGYDVTDFYSLNDRFGTKEDLEDLLDEAHDRGIRVIFDFPLNHTSTKHKWMEEHPEWYVWEKETPQGWGLPWGGGNPYNVWRFHRSQSHFYSAFANDDMADLNYMYKDASGHYPVRDEMNKVAKYWLDRGFDGIRYDAVRYIVEDGAGKQADSPETHQIFREMRASLNDYTAKDKSYKVMIAEAWTDEPKVGQYFGDGRDEFNICFDFMGAQRLPSAIEQESTSLLTSLWEYEQENYPDGYTMGLFQNNHDNVTSRPGTQFEGDKYMQVLSAAVTVFGPGVPFIYYGNEIGMEGEMGNDANLRVSIDWNEVDKQDDDKESLLNWYRHIIKAHNVCPSLSGKMTLLGTGDDSYLAFEKEKDGEKTLVVMNFTSKPKDISLDLSQVKVKPDSGISPVLGNLPKKAKLKGTTLELKGIPGYGVNVIWLEGKKPPKKVAGYVK